MAHVPRPIAVATGASSGIGLELATFAARHLDGDIPMPKQPHPAPTGPEADAKGQSESNHKGGGNDGVSSADPRVFSRKDNGDATFPLKQDERKQK